MSPMSLNQMTMPNASTLAVMDMAKTLGFGGVELRNDLAGKLFDGKSTTEIRDEARKRGLRIHALAEVYAFNDNTAQTRAEVLKLTQQARESGASAIALIPRLADEPVDRDIQRAQLLASLEEIKPILDDNGITALIEPLGFANSSLRYKADVMAVLEDMGRPVCFGLIHDTFHHTLSGETELYAEATHIVHISGIADASVTPSEMTDAHRGLVDHNDRLGNIAQISNLLAQGYTGPLSFEVFSTDVHEMTDPTEALLASTAFINSQVAKMAA